MNGIIEIGRLSAYLEMGYRNYSIGKRAGREKLSQPALHHRKDPKDWEN